MVIARLPPSRFALRRPGKGSRSIWVRLKGSRSVGTFVARVRGSRSALIPAVAFLIVAVRSAAAQPPPPILQEPQTLLLWPDGAPGELGQEDRDKPAITIYMPPDTT